MKFEILYYIKGYLTHCKFIIGYDGEDFKNNEITVICYKTILYKVPRIIKKLKRYATRIHNKTNSI